MPPKDKKQAVSRPSKPQIRRPKVKSSSSSSPPAMRKRRAATTLKSRAQNLQKERSLPSGSKAILISQSSSSSEDPMASTTESSSSSSINEDNVLDKLEKIAKMAEENEALAQKADAFWAARARGESGAHVFGHGKATKKQKQSPAMVTQEQQTKSNNTLLLDLNTKVNFMVESLACVESRLDVLFKKHDTLSAQIALLTPTSGPVHDETHPSPQEKAPKPPQ